jgi:hypothetical protein
VEITFLEVEISFLEVEISFLEVEISFLEMEKVRHIKKIVHHRFLENEIQVDINMD